VDRLAQIRRKGPHLLFSAVLALSAVSLPSTDAHAQTPSEIATAKQWFADGLAKEEKSDFAGALDLFKRAAQVKRTPQIVYHVGFCESRTGALVEALVDLESAVAIARAAHADDVVTAASAELADVQKRTPRVEVRVAEVPPASRFLVDGRAVALSMLRAPMPLNPGEHSVTVELANGATATKKVTLAERDAIKVDLAPASDAAPPTPAPAAAPEKPTASPAPPPAPEAQSSSPVPWVLVGGGAAVAVTGVVLMFVARGKEGDLDKSCPSHAGCDPKLESDYDSAKTLNALGIGLGAVGIVAAGVGVSMLVLRPSASTATSATLVLSPRGIDLAAKF
jgi:hypothetical protein